MSDFAAHLEKVLACGSRLRGQLDDLITDLLSAEQTAREIGGADLGVPGELSATDHDDLLSDLQQALRGLRGAERTVDRHMGEVKAEQARIEAGETRSW